ncbi:hypothetical protein ACFV3F_03540 [Streptomyces sp. NPDC059717]|uniref:hypothetical protein n=1 Tax=Streptomyces sp. NPDC059717 TaxID=3346922 RepID=UPI0036810158
MSTQNSEPQLADEARTALLAAVIKSAKADRGQNALALAEAYAVLNTSAPREDRELKQDTYQLSTYRVPTR